MADVGQMTDAQTRVYDRIVGGKRGKIVGPLRAALHSPELADRWQALGEFLRFETSLPAHISELAVICTGRYWNCQLEWVIHSGIAEDAGLAGDVIESIRRAQSPNFDDPLQGTVYEFTRELLEYGQVSDGVYHELLGLIGVAALVELTAVIGYYSMVAMTLNVHRVPLPENENGSLLDLQADNHLLEPTRLKSGTNKEKVAGGTKR
jgi:4-carboxymuconolactone decarboxylase